MRNACSPLQVLRLRTQGAHQPECLSGARAYRRSAGAWRALRVTLLFLGAALFIASSPDFAFGQVVWDGGNGNWFGGWLGTLPGNPAPFPAPTTNWNCEFCYPGAGDTVNIGTLYGSPIGAVTGTVTLNSATAVAGVALGNGTFGGLQVHSGGNLTTGGLTIGTIAPGSGTLTVSSGGVVNTGFAWLGTAAGASGGATVTGSGSQLNVSTQLFVGNSGQGTLTIQNGGLVTSPGMIIALNPGSLGQVTVDGAGTQWNSTGVIGVASSGHGSLTVQNGGVAHSQGGNIGNSPGGNGSVTVTGAGSQWNLASGQLYVGSGGSGTLNVQSGGVVSTSATAFLGTAAGTGSATVDGIGSQLNIVSLNVGYAGHGTLLIQDGGVVNSGVANSSPIGNTASGIGFVTVSGAGSHWNADDLAVGLSGQGTLTIQNSGQVSDASATVGAGIGSAGDVLVNAGTWTTSGSLDIGINGTGAVTVENGGELSAGSIRVGGNGSLIIDPAIVDVLGNFKLDANGVLSLDIGGTTAGLFSQLDISGSGLFQGTIDFDFINGFAPTMGESFDLINALGADFSHATIQIEGLEPGFQYTDAFANGQFTLVADNNGVSTTTPEPSSMWLAATAIAVLSLAGLRNKLRSRS